MSTLFLIDLGSLGEEILTNVDKLRVPCPHPPPNPAAWQRARSWLTWYTTNGEAAPFATHEEQPRLPLAVGPICMAHVSQPPVSAAPTSTRRQVFTLAVPAVGEQLLNTTVGLADVFLLGNLALAAAATLGYGRVEAVAAAGLGNQMIWLVNVLFMSLAIGSTAMIARAAGAKDAAQMQHVLQQSLLFAVGMGGLGMLVMIFLAQPFLALLNTPLAVRPLATTYMQIISVSLIPTALLMVGTACLRGVGDTRTPLYVMLGANVVNVILTWLLVSGNWGMPALGVTGAAIGTAVARIGGGVVVLALLLRGRSGLQILPRPHVDVDILRRLTVVGAPSAGEMLVFQLALIVFIRFVNDLGTAAYAAHTAIIIIESISFLPGFGYAYAASALVGQSLGAKEPQQAHARANEATLQGMLLMTLVGIVIVLFPAQLLGLFVNDPRAVALGAPALLAAGLIQPTLAVGFILNGALRGAGDTRFPLYARIATTWGVRLPLTWLLVGVLGMGLNGIWLAMCMDFTAQAYATLWRFFSGRWQAVDV